MTILAVSQGVALAVGIARPLTVFAATTREMQELQAVANEAAAVVADGHDWQRLLKTRAVAGDGINEAFDLPADYRRMTTTGSIWLSRTRSNSARLVSLDDWLSLDVWPALPTEGVWALFGGQLHLKPIMRTGETAKFFYLRNDIVAGGKTVFDADADSFVLDERLLKLAMIYLWKQGKGQDFTAELSDFEMAMDRAKRADGGSLPVLSGNVPAGRRRSNVWPGRVSG